MFLVGHQNAPGQIGFSRFPIGFAQITAITKLRFLSNYSLLYWAKIFLHLLCYAFFGIKYQGFIEPYTSSSWVPICSTYPLPGGGVT